MEFLVKLVAEMPRFHPREPKPYMVLDNAGAHHARDVVAFASQHFQLKFMPAYSCQFNSVESIWRIVRRNYDKRVTKCALRRDYN